MRFVSTRGESRPVTLSQAIVEVCGEASPADLAGQNKVRACRKDAHNRFDAERDERIAKASQSPILVASR